MKLQIQPVHQAQRTELVLRQFTAEAAVGLVTELRGAFPHELMVKFIIAIHGYQASLKANAPAVPSACLPRSSLTVGPRVRMRSRICTARIFPSTRSASNK